MNYKKRLNNETGNSNYRGKQMVLDISKHGDILEKKYSEFIRNTLPAYELIWIRYIGNDGTAKLISSGNLNEDQTNRRVMFSQYHYSVLESLICIKQIVEKDELLYCNNIDDYLNLQTLLIAFQGHAGRIRDCIMKMGNFFELPNLYISIDDVYKQRNQVLHGCKVPIIIINDIFCLPEIQGIEENTTKWHDNLSWGRVEGLAKSPIIDYMTSTFEELCKEVNKCLFQLLNKIIIIVKEFNIDYESFDRFIITDREGVSGFFDPNDNHVHLANKFDIETP